MKSLLEFSLHDCIDPETLSLYKYDGPQEGNPGEKIYWYLTENAIASSPRHRELVQSDRLKTIFIERVLEQLENGRPLELFATSFNPKPHKIAITNGQVFPDMGELLSILHLSLIANEVNSLYPHGFRFVIGYEGSYFRNAGQFDHETTEGIFKTLLLYQQCVERMLGRTELLTLFDVEKAIEPFSRDFYIHIEKCKFNIVQELPDGYLDELTDYYLNHVYDASWFKTEQLAWDFCQYHALNGLAYDRSRFKGGQRQLGVMNDFPHAIPFSLKYTGEKAEELQLDLMPKVDTYPYNRLTVKDKDGSWQLKRWEHMQGEKLKSVYVKELAFPLYHETT